MFLFANLAQMGNSAIGLDQANHIKRVSLRVQANPLLYFPEHLRLLFQEYEREETLIQFKALLEVTPWRAEDTYQSIKMAIQNPPEDLVGIMDRCGAGGHSPINGKTMHTAYLDFLRSICADWENIFQNHPNRHWYPQGFEPTWPTAQPI